MRSTTFMSGLTSTLTSSGTAKAVAAGALALTALLPQPVAVAAAQAAPPRRGDCAAGELCLWEQEEFRGVRRTYELSDTDIDSCVPLPAGVSVHSLANRTGRPVTTYQSAECGSTGQFETYPGGGTWTPRSPYRVRAFKIWER